mgnify:CR=1 FL=1
MRLAFMGSDEFAIPSLKTVADEHELLAVVTQPDRPRGRGLKPKPTPVKSAAEEMGIKVLEPENPNDQGFLETIRGIGPELIVVVSYGHILKADLLNLPPMGCVNLHPSLLPKYRGAAPIERAIMNGEEETGITTFFMDEGMDTGDIILQEKVRIHDDDDATSLKRRLAELGSGILSRTLRLIEEGRAPRIPQDHTMATYAPKIRKEEGDLDWSLPAKRISNMVRALGDWPGVRTWIDGVEMKLLKVEPMECEDWKGLVPGTILEKRKDGWVVATGCGCILVKEVHPLGKRRMTADEYARGHNIQAGMRFERR